MDVIVKTVCGKDYIPTTTPLTTGQRPLSHHFVHHDFLQDRITNVDLVNWCLTNCQGPFKVAPVTVSTINNGSYHIDKINPFSFNFELDDDAVLFKMMFGGGM